MTTEITPFILASGSPRRKEILQKVGFPIEVHPSQVNEDYNPSASPENFVKHFAMLKANLVAPKFPDRIIIAADTIVVLDGMILGKPKGKSGAIEMLGKLSNKTHSVFTGVALVKKQLNATENFFERTDVTFLPLSNDMIRYYVETSQPFDKAGAYGIQDWSASFVKSINGCYYNVVGFPLSRFLSLLGSTSFQKKFQSDNWLGMVVE